MPDVETPTPTLAQAIHLFEVVMSGGLPSRSDFAAAYPDAPDYDEAMTILTAYPSAHIAANLAARDDLPAAALDRLADYPDLDIVSHVVRNPSTSPDTLLRLLGHPSERIRAQIATLRRADAPERWAVLTADPSDSIQRCLARNTATPLEHLIALAQPDSRYPDTLVNDALPFDVLRAHLASPAATAGPEQWRAHLYSACARRPDTDAETIRALAQVLPAGHYLWQDIIGSDHLDEALALKALTRRIGVEAAVDLASWTEMPATVAARLRRDRRKAVAEALAANPACPSDWLLSLVETIPTRSNALTGAALTNPALPDEHMPTDGPDWALNRAFTNRARRGPALISSWIQAVTRPHYRGQLLRLLLPRPDLTAAHWAQAWDACPGPTHAHGRREMAAHPACPPEVLVAACYDGDHYVRTNAQNNPATPEHAAVAAALLAG